MTPDDFLVVNAHEDKRQRGQLSVLLGVAVAISLVLVRQPSLAGVPGYVWSSGLLTGALLLAWHRKLFRRAHAMLRLSTIRREGLEATAKLNAGDFAGAKVAYGQLISSARLLGAFHAVHVLMYGVACFLEGDAKQGLELASRALDSKWLDLRHTREVKQAAEAWRVMMLLSLGEVKEARRLADSGKVLITAGLTVSAYEEKWDEVIEGAKAALADPAFPPSGRPTIAVLGRFAAKKSGGNIKAFERVLEAERPSALLLQNPALRRFL